MMGHVVIPDVKPGTRRMSVDMCPSHNWYAIALDDQHGGLRLTGSKCCGQWQTQLGWLLTPQQMRDIAGELECAADEAELELDGGSDDDQ